jgi:hypothetical protein
MKLYTAAKLTSNTCYTSNYLKACNSRNYKRKERTIGNQAKTRQQLQKTTRTKTQKEQTTAERNTWIEKEICKQGQKQSKAKDSEADASTLFWQLRYLTNQQQWNREKNNIKGNLMFDAKERTAAAAMLFGYTVMIKLKLYSLTHPKICKLSSKILKRFYKTKLSRNKAQH